MPEPASDSGGLLADLADSDESRTDGIDRVASVDLEPVGTASGISVAEVLALPTMRTARLLAGGAGLNRVVRRMNIMEVPDILPWVKTDELILTTGYPLRYSLTSLTVLIGDLDDLGLAAFAIKLARYIDELPVEMLAEADRRGFPIILLPDDVGFDDILNEVLTEILNKQAAALAHSDEVHREIIGALYAGGGLDEVTAKAAALLSPASVIVVGTQGGVLSSAGPDPHQIEELAEIRSAIATHRSPVRLPSGRSAVAVPVIAGDFDHGWLLALRGDSNHPADTVTILERAAALAALTITQKLAMTAVESRHQSDLIRDLVEGRLDDIERVLDQARWFGWHLQEALVLAVTTLAVTAHQSPRGRRDDLERLAASWRAAVDAHVAGAAVVVVSDQVVTLLPFAEPAHPRGAPPPASPPTTVQQDSVAAVSTPSPADVFTAAGARVAADLHGTLPPASTGISRAVSALSELPAAYAQARRAAQVGMDGKEVGAVISFDSLGVLRLLSLIPDSGELRSYLVEVLGPLMPGASAEHADLRESLRVLLMTNLNVAEAARTLHFHYNTLRYRITKLERILGPFMSDPSVRLNIQLALHLIDVHDLP